MWPGNALPQQGKMNWKVYYAPTSFDNFQTYMKPPGASMIYIFMIAAGGGGGRGPNGASGTGGRGGGSGGMSSLIIPATFIPDIIYVRPGLGGAGATAPSTSGGSGGTSGVTIAPNFGARSIIIQQGGNGGGVGSAGGTGGPEPTADTVYLSLGVFSGHIGANGSSGSTALNTSGGNLAPLSAIITTGGTGGGSGTGNGGAISGSGLYPSMTQANVRSADGRVGFQRGLIFEPGLKFLPPLFSGGLGGNGTSSANTAGRGGDGAYGGGGGGGGVGTNAGSISGNGGNGGDGLIVIGSF